MRPRCSIELMDNVCRGGEGRGRGGGGGGGGGDQGDEADMQP